jgi:type I restriction-modification system DNA methylase subunit
MDTPYTDETTGKPVYDKEKVRFVSTHIDEIIKRMGYAESSYLYKRATYKDAPLSAHYKKVLGEILPYAVYVVKNEPFVLFYEEMTDEDERKQRNRKIWNAQIPVTIVCGIGDVKIYNSCSIDREKSAFNEVDSIPANQVDENSPFSYWEITSQNFWDADVRIKQFSGEKLNDHLLNNLSDITKKLREDYKVSFATKLMLRLIFIRYLIDREVDLDYKGFKSDAAVSKDNLLKLLLNKTELYNLFLHLKGKFNGNLFELDNEIDDPCLTADALKVLADFMSANIDTKTGQLSFFDLYDFNIIPVELISNIYEILLGKENQDEGNAFYTPHYLVDYILDDSVRPFIRDNGACKVLDPSCGSGIFLVESYRRMVEKELNGEPFTTDDEFLKNILSENIYGVDLNGDAIDIAIFSLYVAVLDYKNPKTLKKFTLPKLKDHNLFVGDFFNVHALKPLEEIPFDFIVGNPPWSSKKGLHDEYCKRKGYSELLQNHDTCRSFILRSKDFCIANTQCCFVLHSKMLYLQKDPSKRFREFLLTKTKISKIVELSSVRTLVFKNAKAPAVILMYSFSEGNPLENRFEYISMKPNLFFRLFSIVVVEKPDIKYVPQKLLLENDWAWKTLVYGLSGDIDVIGKTKKMFITIKQAIDMQIPKLLKGAGVKYNDGDRKDASHLIERKFLDSEAVDHFSLDMSRMSAFSKSKVDRPRDEKLFHAPYCLLLTGIDTSNYTMRAVFSDVDFVFRSALYAIKGVEAQKGVLLNFTGLFNSSFYAYLNLMMDSSLGIEREQRLFEEILELPFVYSDDIAKQVEIIQGLSCRENFAVAEDTARAIESLNRMILKAFNLADNAFVDYALNVQIPQLTKKNCRVFRAAGNQDLIEYAKPFLDALSAVFSVSGKSVSANIYPRVAKYYSMVEVVLHNNRTNGIQVKNDATSLQTALTKFSAHKVNDMFFELKDVIHFEDDSFYIIKPNYYKNWHPAIAQLDLAEVVDQILSENGGNN